ncbi:uncharacterized protein LOC113565415 [Drosophila persimilis]|uniref:uncharacterized protein LOC113565415 n=1 Tax=Drosophila persimilis TaxID=7234 RepID=UPI000F077C61|nr:uncharacterized protein LOC113565415 [Drosophila persimilis]
MTVDKITAKIERPKGCSLGWTVATTGCCRHATGLSHDATSAEGSSDRRWNCWFTPMGNNVSNAPFIHRRIKRWALKSRRRTYVPYALPQTESYPIYLRQMESYPIITETYSRHAEAFPRPIVSVQDRT